MNQVRVPGLSVVGAAREQTALDLAQAKLAPLGSIEWDPRQMSDHWPRRTGRVAGLSLIVEWRTKGSRLIVMYRLGETVYTEAEKRDAQG